MLARFAARLAAFAAGILWSSQYFLRRRLLPVILCHWWFDVLVLFLLPLR